MARIDGKRGDGEGSVTKQRSPSSQADGGRLATEALDGPRRHSSGVFEKLVPEGNPRASAEQVARSQAVSARASRHAGHPERLSVDSGSSMGRAILRLFGAGAAGVMLVPPALDGAETADLRGQLAVELRAVSAEVVAGLLPRQLLLEIRADSGRPGLFVRGQRIRFRGNEKRLLDYLLESPAMCASNDDVEQLLWRRQRGDLGARRRELVSRMNRRLKRALKLDEEESHSSFLPIESSEHSTRINLDACKAESEKV